jgi:hypothetical protein
MSHRGGMLVEFLQAIEQARPNQIQLFDQMSDQGRLHGRALIRTSAYSTGGRSYSGRKR